MRTDDGTKYRLPGIFHHDNPDLAKYWKRGITLDLEGLPMIHDDGVQTGVGARGWYNSAVLSALLLLFASSESESEDSIGDTEKGDSSSNNMGDLLRQDMIKIMRQQEIRSQKNPIVLEIGAGALGLVGMTMAWILSHKQQFVGDADEAKLEERYADDDMNIEMVGGEDNESKIILTDNDVEVLTQLQCNVTSVLRSLLEFNSVMNKEGNNKKIEEQEEEGSSSPWSVTDQEIPFLSLPSIQTNVLDWDDYAVDQDVLVNHKIDFVVGAELAYTSNNCCALQVAKILELNPHAIVWIVQFPRKGWFQVFQLELKKALPNVLIQKTDPSQLHQKVHQLAQTIMPMPHGMGTNVWNDDVASHQHFQQNLADIKALRITLKPSKAKVETAEEGKRKTATLTPSGVSSNSLNEKIQQAKRLSEQLNSAQEFALDSHWEIG